jgi:hypothetical protein
MIKEKLNDSFLLVRENFNNKNSQDKINKEQFIKIQESFSTNKCKSSINSNIGSPVLGIINEKDKSILESKSNFDDTPFDPYYLARKENTNPDFCLKNMANKFSKKYKNINKKTSKIKHNNYAFGFLIDDPYKLLK